MKFLLRKLKINNIEPVKFTQEELKLLEFILSKISNLTVFKMDEYPNSIFYMNSKGEYIFENNFDYDWLRC